MTILGRTTEKWGRDRSARWDSHEGNGFRTRSYPGVRTVDLTPHLLTIAALDGRPGYAERDMALTRKGTDVTIALAGWYNTTLDLNERQALFLRDTLNSWFPNE